MLSPGLGRSQEEEEGWVLKKPDWGSQLTTGRWLPGFPGRGMRDMKGKFFRKRKHFWGFFPPSSLIADPWFLCWVIEDIWKGVGCWRSVTTLPGQQSHQGWTLWGSSGQPSSLLLEWWCHIALVLKIVHQEKADSVSLPHLPLSLFNE